MNLMLYVSKPSERLPSLPKTPRAPQQKSLEVTLVLRGLFDSLTLTPAWVSVDFAAQCRAQAGRWVQGLGFGVWGLGFGV